MPEKVGWWAVFSVVGVGAFGLCVTGFFFLHGMVLDTRAEASTSLSRAVEARTKQMDRMYDDIKDYQKQNSADHKEIMAILLKLSRP